MDGKVMFITLSLGVMFNKQENQIDVRMKVVFALYYVARIVVQS